MVRAYTIYIIMFVTLAAGLWAILTFGGRLSAPRDLSGAWLVEWETEPPVKTKHDADGDAAPTPMRVSQSGRYVNVALARELQLNLKIVSGTAIGRGDDPKLAAELEGDGWTMRLADVPETEDLHVVLRGPGDRAFTGYAARPAPDAQQAAAPIDGPIIDGPSGPAPTTQPLPLEETADAGSGGTR